ncbi:bifunctional lysylphosphatidylglycerol flippase/synthetase MprF [Actinosynnema mirum]|uniref:Phosphatidylglycerol lysyltransferase C-terminal domain-containing protein n=1 Tax=Actinosynnema mirum (strain ATCC 29888 / DSM 43827 / JCM 3225 / NBRC 14064 / NCIMB 13271 / NRRL B-12336 / IMRU 3971 / 101) TaxID=446462 RepID=C6W9S5_ACTMD|nr:DUF2156 domain-containing protein [Actinosynnema mirum]ACU37292.1 protein of unknown function DUF470 [Actinosynnema mirum DSM 43827]
MAGDADTAVAQQGDTGGPPGAVRAWTARALRAMAGAPVTASLVAVLWTLAAVTGSLHAGPSPQLRDLVAAGVRPLAEGRWWTPLTSALWAHGWVAYAVSTLVALAVLPVVERRLGSPRTAALLVGVQVVGVLVGVGLLAVAPGEWAHDLAGATSIGPIGAVLGAALAGSAELGPRWRRRLRLLLVTALVMMTLYAGLLVDFLRLSVGLTGLAAVLLARRRPRPAPHPPSAAEARALVALVVAVAAVGPVVAVLARTPIGPLSVLHDLFIPTPLDAADVQALCAAPADGVLTDAADAVQCKQMQAALRLSGAGPAVLSLIPVLLLLVAAEGLRRGRRAAWWTALALHGVFAVLGLELVTLLVEVPEEERVYFAGLPGAQSLVAMLLPLALPTLVFLLVASARSRFPVRHPDANRAAATIGLALLGAVGVWLLGGWLARSGFDRATGFGDLLTELPHRFVPPGYLVETPPAFLPSDVPTTVLFEWTGPAFWLVTAAVLLRLFTRAPSAALADERERVEELLRADPRSDLARMVLWEGHRYWFTPDGGTALAYRVIGSVALTTGGPFGAPGTDVAAVAGFTAFCRDNGWIPCLYTVTEPVRAACADQGYSTVQVAEETVLDLPGLAFTGKAWQDVRTALNQAAKKGITAEWHTLAELPLGMADQVKAIAEEWIADKGMPEMGFTLGGLAELAEPGTRLLLAVDADRTVHGVTSWLPVYRDGVVVGWTLDFMRRRTDGFRGVVEFLIASAAQSCRDEGALLLSLSGAPLARRDRGGEPTRLQRLLDHLASTLEPVYGFRSLLAFKAKFQPDYRPLHMAYPEGAALPAIGRALMRAYLPQVSARQIAALTRKLLD